MFGFFLGPRLGCERGTSEVAERVEETGGGAFDAGGG